MIKALDPKLQVRMLVGCVEDNDLPAVQQLLASGCALSDPRVKKDPLTSALTRSYEPIVEALLDAGATLPTDATLRKEAVDAGIRLGNLRVFEQARAAGAIQSTLGALLADAARNRREAFALRLLELGASPAEREGFAHGEPRTAFEFAAKFGGPQLVRAMLAKLTITEMNDLLVGAVGDNEPKVVRALLEAGADGTQKIMGMSLLQLAPPKAEEIKRMLKSALTAATIDAAMGGNDEQAPAPSAKNSFAL